MVFVSWQLVMTCLVDHHELNHSNVWKLYKFERFGQLSFVRNLTGLANRPAVKKKGETVTG